VRCDSSGSVHWCSCDYFNPRTYVRCDTIINQIYHVSLKFQSTHLREVRHHLQNRQSELRAFQSTHLREVRHLNGYVINSPGDISIHAPTWGATITSSITIDDNYISIHAPTWGATFLLLSTKCERSNFNPRTYVRCDWNFIFIQKTTSDFNPRTYVRCDLETGLYIKNIPLFQSTHLREVRRGL